MLMLCCNTSNLKKKITFISICIFFLHLCILCTKGSQSWVKMTFAWCTTNCCNCTTSVSCTSKKRKKKNGGRVESCLYLPNWSAENWCLVIWHLITPMKAGGTAKCEYLIKLLFHSSNCLIVLHRKRQWWLTYVHPVMTVLAFFPLWI